MNVRKLAVDAIDKIMTNNAYRILTMCHKLF